MGNEEREELTKQLQSIQRCLTFLMCFSLLLAVGLGLLMFMVGYQFKFEQALVLWLHLPYSPYTLPEWYGAFFGK